MMHVLSALFLLISFSAHAEFVKQKNGCENYEDAGFKGKADADAFLAKLKTAKTADDFVKLVTFPLKINFDVTAPKGTDRHHITILNEETVKQKFESLFSEKVLTVIQKQDPNGMFCNYQGMTLGHGTVWIAERKGRIGIFAINQP